MPVPKALLSKYQAISVNVYEDGNGNEEHLYDD